MVTQCLRILLYMSDSYHMKICTNVIFLTMAQ